MTDTKREARREVMRELRDLAREAMERGLTYRNDVIEDVAAWRIDDGREEGNE